MKMSSFFLAALCLQRCASITVKSSLPESTHFAAQELRDAHAQFANRYHNSDVDKAAEKPAEKRYSDKSMENVTFKQKTNGSTPTGWIQVGDPKKWLYVIFDTGSDKLVAKTWETIDAELQSVDQGVPEGMVLPSESVYNHESSKTYVHRKFFDPETNKTGNAQTSITYGSGTAICDVGGDDITVGDRTLENFTIMEITADSLQLLHTSKGIAGVLGMQHMKNKSLGNSLFSRLRDKQIMSAFGYCRGTGNNGTFLWGAPAPKSHEQSFVANVIGQMHWAVTLGNVRVDVNSTANSSHNANSTTNHSGLIQTADLLMRKRVKVGKTLKKTKKQSPDGSGGGSDGFGDDDSSGGDGSFTGPLFDDAPDATSDPKALVNICPNASCTGILDSGSNIIAGPTDVMTAITEKINVSPDCSNFDQLPDILLTFGGHDVSVPPSGYVMKVPKPKDDPFGMGGGDGSGGAGFAKEQATTAGLANGAGLEEKAVTTDGERRAAIKQQWTRVFARLHKARGIDLRAIVAHVLKQENETKEEFLCMPALVPIDRTTQHGALYIVGTPLLDAYSAVWSFPQNATSPHITLQKLDESEMCKDTSDAHIGDVIPQANATSTHSQNVTMAKKPMVRKESHDPDAMPDPVNKDPDFTATRTDVPGQRRGPTVQLIEEIRFPEWAKSLMQV